MAKRNLRSDPPPTDHRASSDESGSQSQPPSLLGLESSTVHSQPSLEMTQMAQMIMQMQKNHEAIEAARIAREKKEEDIRRELASEARKQADEEREI